MRSATLLVTSVVGLLWASAAAADVQLAGVFGDHMVLQRDMDVPVWGWADPNEQVTGSLGGRSKPVTADAQGKWLAQLDDPLEAGGPHVLTVTCSATDDEVTVSDVLVGEVWLCSGQSNMAMQVETPVAARYNWANNPDGNLVNGAGLPAAPFRTDDW